MSETWRDSKRQPRTKQHGQRAGGTGAQYTRPHRPHTQQSGDRARPPWPLANQARPPGRAERCIRSLVRNGHPPFQPKRPDGKPLLKHDQIWRRDFFWVERAPAAPDAAGPHNHHNRAEATPDSRGAFSGYNNICPYYSTRRSNMPDKTGPRPARPSRTDRQAGRANQVLWRRLTCPQWLNGSRRRQTTTTARGPAGDSGAPARPPITQASGGLHGHDNVTQARRRPGDLPGQSLKPKARAPVGARTGAGGGHGPAGGGGGLAPPAGPKSQAQSPRRPPNYGTDSNGDQATSFG